MTAKEVREFRNVSRKLVEVEERSKMFQVLRKQGVTLSEEEYQVKKNFSKFRVLGDKRGVLDKNRRDIVSLSLTMKIKDNNLFGVKLRRKKNWLIGRLEDGMGKKSLEFRMIMKEVREHNAKLRGLLKEKNRKKVNHLTRKFGEMGKPEIVWMDVKKDVRDLMGCPRIFDDKKNFSGEGVKEPVIVAGQGEDIILGESEKEILKLGPKFCVYKRLCDEEFEVDVEECILKIKWDMMSDEERGCPGTEDKALEILLGAKICDKIDAEKDEEREMKEGAMRSIFDWTNCTMNLSKRRATDVKGNARVIFPRQARSLEVESALQTMRMELFTLFRQYRQEKCDHEGNQKSNLTRIQEDGLRKVRKRVKDGDLVIIPTDKRGNWL